MSTADLPHDVGVLRTVPESLTARQSSRIMDVLDSEGLPDRG